MKKLYLVRHAKSSWKDTSLHDKDRPLKTKGINDAYKIAERIASRNVYPELILSSSATRAWHTARIMSDVLQYPINRIRVKDTLYECNKNSIFNELSLTTTDIESVMLIGHDPSLTNFANFFLPKPKEKIPTSSILHFEFDCDEWSELKNVPAKLIFLESPKN